MNIGRGYCSAIALPGDREALVLGGSGGVGVTETTAVLDLGTMVFTTAPACDGECA